MYLATDAAAQMRAQGIEPPASAYEKYTVMGKVFDPADPEGRRELVCDPAEVTFLDGFKP